MLSLEQRDLEVNWHPYTQMKSANRIIPIVRGEGAYIYDDQGNRYIDAVSSWWVTLHGHAHPYIAEKVSAQLSRLEQVIFAGFTHPPAIELSERLLNILPENQHKVFYSDNGSTAVEVALKMAIQYHYNKGGKRKKIVAFKNSYHGDTFGAMSVSARGVWTFPFNDLLFEVVFIEVPSKENLEVLKHQIKEIADEVVCFIYEPLIQGAAGMLMHNAEDLNALLTCCRENGILMIQDEVFVGFGRTGKLFAANHLTEIPDMMCFSKGLTGGTMPLGVTTCSWDVFSAFYSEDQEKTLFHGHSFTANPLACTAALASLDLLLQQETQDRIQNIVSLHEGFTKRLISHPNVRNVRQCGTIVALDWNTEAESSYFNELRTRLYPYFLEKGILLRPLGNTIYLVPPYCTSTEDLEYIYDKILLALDEL